LEEPAGAVFDAWREAHTPDDPSGERLELAALERYQDVLRVQVGREKRRPALGVDLQVQLTMPAGGVCEV